MSSMSKAVELITDAMVDAGLFDDKVEASEAVVSWLDELILHRSNYIKEKEDRTQAS